MVSREEMLGERERKEVGVEGMLEEKEEEEEGKGSLYVVVVVVVKSREGLEVLVRRGMEVVVVAGVAVFRYTV